LLLFAAVLQFSRPGFVALTGSLLAMLLFAPLWLLRDWSQLSKASPFAQAGLMVGGALLALASTFQLGVGRWLPLLALPLALLAFAHQWHKARQFPSQFPVGRRYSGNSVK
jgi:peptidoglycan/LPS O-acetylase OafA/YrhL